MNDATKTALASLMTAFNELGESVRYAFSRFADKMAATERELGIEPMPEVPAPPVPVAATNWAYDYTANKWESSGEQLTPPPVVVPASTPGPAFTTETSFTAETPGAPIVVAQLSPVPPPQVELPPPIVAPVAAPAPEVIPAVVSLPPPQIAAPQPLIELTEDDLDWGIDDSIADPGVPRCTKCGGVEDVQDGMCTDCRTVAEIEATGVEPDDYDEELARDDEEENEEDGSGDEDFNEPTEEEAEEAPVTATAPAAPSRLPGTHGTFQAGIAATSGGAFMSGSWQSGGDA